MAGSPGSGKTTLARNLARTLDLPYVEIDSLFHGPNWVPRETFLQDVTEFVSADQWVTEWQYTVARPVLLERATTLVWLDLPTWRVQVQLWRRTFTRWITRQELWNGNREPGLRVLFSQREDSILWWGWIKRNWYRDLPTMLTEVAARGQIPAEQMDRLVVVHLRTHRQVRAWLKLQGVSHPPQGSPVNP